MGFTSQTQKTLRLAAPSLKPEMIAFRLDEEIKISPSPSSSVAQGTVSVLAVSDDFTFDDIAMREVDNPIVIDQMYCPRKMCSRQVHTVSFFRKNN